MLKATKVDGIYDRDPALYPDARRLPRVTYQEALQMQLKIMDAAAFALCQENRIPIVVFGSTLVLKLVERFPSIMYIGAAVLAFTAGKMIVNEKLLADFFKGPDTVHQLAYWAVCLTAILGVLAAGWLRNRRGSTGGPSGQAA